MSGRECSDLSRLLPVVLKALEQAVLLPDDVLVLFEQCDALRKPERFIELLRTAQLVAEVSVVSWQNWLDTVRAIDAGAAARLAPTPQQIKAHVRAARLLALNNIMMQDCRD